MSPKVESKLNSLAMLLQDEDNFQDVFKTKHQSVTTKATKFKQNDHIADLLSKSKMFMLKNIPHEYKESEQIFYIREANPNRHQINQCISCCL